MQKRKYVAVVYGRVGGRFAKLGFVLHIRRPAYLVAWLTHKSYKFKDWTRVYLYDSRTSELVEIFDR